MARLRGVLLDVDGTLVDSNNQHALAWREALAEGGYDLSYEAVRELIGMGGDQLLPRLTGLDAEGAAGKALSQRYTTLFRDKYMPTIRPFPGTRELLGAIAAAGLTTVVATSADAEALDGILTNAELGELLPLRTTAADAAASKPDADIVHAALHKVGLCADAAIMLGDTPYDVAAALKAAVPIIALRCGGWADQDLRGAIAIYDGPLDLYLRFDTSLLARHRHQAADAGPMTRGRKLPSSGRDASDANRLPSG